MNTSLRTLALAALVAATLIPATAFAGRTLQVFGLTDDQRLVRFESDDPDDVDVIAAISLSGADGEIVGIDFRPQDGELYGVGDLGGIYTIDTGTAVGTLVSQLTVALEGTKFGVDFNPAADRLRVVSNTGQNLRHDVNAGGSTTADGVLAYTLGTPAVGIGGVAYTNNDLDASTATTLFDIDSALDQVAIQAPANNGSLSPTGKLGRDASDDIGFDIYSGVRGGIARFNLGLAVLTADGVTRLFTVQLLTGTVSGRGRVELPVVDIAVALDDD